MKRIITYKVAFNGPRANVPTTQAVTDAFKRVVPGQGSFGANAVVTVVKTTEGQGRPGVAPVQTAHQLVAELKRVANGRYDATAQAQVKALVTKIEATLGRP